MTEQIVIDIMQKAFEVSIYVAGPVLLAALITGVAVSIFQAVTSIQEQTLVLVPKMCVVILSLIVFFSFQINTVIEFTRSIILSIPDLIK